MQWDGSVLSLRSGLASAGSFRPAPGAKRRNSGSYVDFSTPFCYTQDNAMARRGSPQPPVAIRCTSAGSGDPPGAGGGPGGEVPPAPAAHGGGGIHMVRKRQILLPGSGPLHLYARRAAALGLHQRRVDGQRRRPLPLSHPGSGVTASSVVYRFRWKSRLRLACHREERQRRPVLSRVTGKRSPHAQPGIASLTLAMTRLGVQRRFLR